MNNNNLEYYKLDFYDKRMKLISEANWEEIDFDIEKIVGDAVGIAGSLGSAGIDITKLTAYFAKNLAIFITPKKIKEAFAKKKKEIQDEIALARSKSDGLQGKWNTFVQGMSKDSREIFKSIDRNIESLDRRSQKMFREAGLSESQTLALLFSTNPALALADYLKNKKSRDPKDPNADKTIDNIQKAIANTLINSVKGQKNAGDVKKYCKNKIINRENVEPDYLITQNIQDLIETWINRYLGNDAPKILFKKITNTGLEKTSKKLIKNASDGDAIASFKLIRNILSGIDKQKKEEDRKKTENISRLQFNNKSLLLVESSNSKGLNKSVLYNTIAWLILESTRENLLNENLKELNESNEIIEAIKQYINKFLDDKDKEAENIDIDIADEEQNDDESSDSVTPTPEQEEEINEFASQAREEFVESYSISIINKRFKPSFIEQCINLIKFYLICSSLDKNFVNFRESLIGKLNTLSNIASAEFIDKFKPLLDEINDENFANFILTLEKNLVGIKNLVNSIKGIIQSGIITINDQENNFNEYLTNAIGFDYEGALNKIKADRIELERQQ